MQRSSPPKPKNPFLYIPNIIGYCRIMLLFISLWLMQVKSKETTAIVFYCTSCLLDAIDGHAARILGQATKFGAVLDMVTDRVSTCCLLMTLCGRFGCAWRLGFQLLLALDISSHWMLMYNSLCKGFISHKQTPKEYHALVKLYYSNKICMFTVCAGCEMFYLGLLHFGKCKLFLVPLGVLCAFKQVTNVLQLVESSKDLAALK